jgi:hypothetical protein
MPNDLNSHEMIYVNRFLARHNLTSEFFDIDVLNWIPGPEAEQIWRDTHSVHIHYSLHAKLIQHIWDNNGFPIVGEEGQLQKEDGVWNYVENEHDLSPYRYLDFAGIQGCAGFLLETPEIILAMFTDPRMVALGTGQNSTANVLLGTSREVKYEMYFDCWPDLEPRRKYHGSEKIIGLTGQVVVQLYQRFGMPRSRVWRTSYAEFIRSLMPEPITY